MRSFTKIRSSTKKDGEWSFQKYGSRKICVKFPSSRSLDFCANCQVVSDYRSRSRILKGKKSLGLAKKNASLAVTLSLAFTIRHPSQSMFLSKNRSSLKCHPLQTYLACVEGNDGQCRALHYIYVYKRKIKDLNELLLKIKLTSTSVKYTRVSSWASIVWSKVLMLSWFIPICGKETVKGL